MSPNHGGADATLPVQLALGLRSLALVDTDAEMQARLAYAIRAAMVAKGWKAPELAKAIKRDASTVARWAKGESVPNLLMTKPLSDALGVKPAFLYDPPPVPDYPLAEYLVAETLEEAYQEGRRRARLPRAAEAPSEPQPSPGRRSRVAG